MAWIKMGGSKKPIEHIFDWYIYPTTIESEWTKTANVTKSGKGLICLLGITLAGGSNRLQILKNGTPIFDEEVTHGSNRFIDIDVVEGDVITFKKFGSNLATGVAIIV